MAYDTKIMERGLRIMSHPGLTNAETKYGPAMTSYQHSLLPIRGIMATIMDEL
jgi:hypothetical protein